VGRDAAWGLRLCPPIATARALSRTVPTPRRRGAFETRPRTLSVRGRAHSLTRDLYSPAVFLRCAAFPAAGFFAAISIGTMSPFGAPQPSFAAIFGCLYRYVFPS